MKKHKTHCDCVATMVQGQVTTTNFSLPNKKECEIILESLYNFKQSAHYDNWYESQEEINNIIHKIIKLMLHYKQ